MIKVVIYLFAILLLIGCSCGDTKYLPQQVVAQMVEKEYDSLRANLKDSIALNITGVNDYDNVFSIKEKVILDSLIHEVQRQTGIKLAIFTFDSTMLKSNSVSDVTRIICIHKKINSTIGIAIPYKEISIWNDSLTNNAFLGQVETKRIIDEEFIPLFKEGDYFKGTQAGVSAMLKKMRSAKKSFNGG